PGRTRDHRSYEGRTGGASERFLHRGPADHDRGPRDRPTGKEESGSATEPRGLRVEHLGLRLRIADWGIAAERRFPAMHRIDPQFEIRNPQWAVRRFLPPQES